MTWWLGVTATPERKDGLEQVTTWQLGPVRHVITDTLPSQDNLVTAYDGPRRELCVHETQYRWPPDLDPTQAAGHAVFPVSPRIAGGARARERYKIAGGEKTTNSMRSCWPIRCGSRSGR